MKCSVHSVRVTYYHETRKGNLVGSDPRAHFGHGYGARKGWKTGKLAAGPKGLPVLCDCLMMDFVLAWAW